MTIAVDLGRKAINKQTNKGQLDIWYLFITITSVSYTHLASIIIWALRVIEKNHFSRV